MPRTRLIIPPEYADLLVENVSLQRELSLMNRYAARLAQRLVDHECRAEPGQVNPMHLPSEPARRSPD